MITSPLAALNSKGSLDVILRELRCIKRFEGERENAFSSAKRIETVITNILNFDSIMFQIIVKIINKK
jgi:hypothetical protein